MKKHFLLSSLLGWGLLVSVIGCSNPAPDDGKVDTGEKAAQTGGDSSRVAVAAKVGDNLSAANFADANFAKSILENDKTVIVDFSATWCGPCQKLKPILHELEGEGLVHVVTIDTDQYPEIATAFGVQGIPHLLFVKDGKLVETSTGYQEKEALVSVINKLSP